MKSVGMPDDMCDAGSLNLYFLLLWAVSEGFRRKIDVRSQFHSMWVVHIISFEILSFDPVAFNTFYLRNLKMSRKGADLRTGIIIHAAAFRAMVNRQKTRID